MDHMMPGMDGVQATKLIRGMGYQRPIVALTANVIKGQADLFVNNGFSGYVAKPIDVKRLDECLMHFIRDKQPADKWFDAKMYSSDAVRPMESVVHALSDEFKPHPGLVISFLSDADRVIASLQPMCDILVSGENLDEDTLRLYTSHVHGMKSALHNVGRKKLSEEAAELEEAGRDTDFGKIRSSTPVFMQKLREVAESLRLPMDEDEADEDEDPAYLRACLQDFKAACADYSKKNARRALKAIEEKICSKQTKEKIAEIAALLLSGDFEEAAELADRVSESL